jgi:syntaxin-binding protein 5
VFSFKQNLAQHYFEYEVLPGALGGNSDTPSHELRKPRLNRALWHPNGIFVLTVHDDNSLVFWDSKDGRKILARTIQATDVDQPGASNPVSPGITLGSNQGISKVAWCIKENGDDSGILIAGGRSASEVNKGLTFLDLGPSPNYQTSTWPIITKYFETPQQQTNIPTPPGAEVADFCVIPRSSPYYGGAHDPIAVITLLSSGELITMSFPSGHPITPTNMVHPYLSFVHPFVNKMSYAPIDRGAWLGLRERRSQGPKFVLGGAEAKKPLKRFEHRNILVTAHADGIVRLWDPGHDDEIENSEVIQVDLARAVGRVRNIEVAQISVAGSTGELSVGLRSGEVVVFRWGNNSRLGIEEPTGANQGPGRLTNISPRTDPGLKRGLLPLTLLEMQQGPVTAIKHSEVGFVAAGFEGGSLAIIDLRGPAVIHASHMSDFLKASKRSSFRKSRVSEDTPPEWPTSIEFGVLTLDNEGKIPATALYMHVGDAHDFFFPGYSSICCFVGTNRGNFATFKLLPAADGTYIVTFAGAIALDDKVISINPIDADRGDYALATPNAVGGLRNGVKINGVVIAVTPAGCRLFKPATSKGAHKSWDDYLCDSAAVVKTEGRGHSLVGLFGDGNARAFSIPALKELGSSRIGHLVDMRRLSESCVSATGSIMSWTGPSEVGMLNAWGSGHQMYACTCHGSSCSLTSLHRRPSLDQLFNAQAVIPPRPTISNIQWLSGTQYVSPVDMDILSALPTALHSPFSPLTTI